MKHSFFSIVPHGTKIDFVGRSKTFLMLSGTVLALALLGLVVRGINWGVEFKGGTEIQVAFGSAVEVGSIRDTLGGAGFDNVSVQSFGRAQDNEFLVRVERVTTLTPAAVAKMKETVKAALGDQYVDTAINEREADRINVFLKGTPMEGAAPAAEGAPAALTDKTLEPNGLKIEEAIKGTGLELRPTDYRRSVLGAGREEHILFVKGVSSRVMEALKAKMGTANPVERRTDYVDATVAGELRTDGLLALLYALGVILLYIAIRFDFFFSPGAIVALFHDVLVAVGVVSWFQLDFDLTLVAAFLTIIGYSINDTIVVYDRVREEITGAESYAELVKLVNLSINETLSRTLLTSATTFFVSLSLLLFGGRALAGFSLAMCVGIITGTYSSFAIATPFYLMLKKRFPEGILAPPKAVVPSKA